MDGTNNSIALFDELKKDSVYAAVLERIDTSLLGTASVKRFFSKFNGAAPAVFIFFVQMISKRVDVDLVFFAESNLSPSALSEVSGESCSFYPYHSSPVKLRKEERPSSGGMERRSSPLVSL